MLIAGTKLGPYEIVAPLGAGGMGEVYRARDTKLNRNVALKVLPDTFALDPDRLARFTREARVSPDGARLIFTETAPKTGEDVMQVELDGRHRVTPLVQSPFAERNGVVSPDGRWLAYEADDSGQFEIHVRPFPAVNSGHWQVSTGGGNRPLWARSGQELFFLSPTGELMRVGIERSATWAATTPTKVLGPGHYYYGAGGYQAPTYDVSPDGQRFLRIKEGGGSDQTSAPPQIIVVQHWVEELKRLVPAGGR